MSFFPFFKFLIFKILLNFIYFNIFNFVLGTVFNENNLGAVLNFTTAGQLGLLKNMRLSRGCGYSLHIS